MNLDSLRRRRVKRLGVRSAGFTGQRRIFFVLDRATRRFHGDISLWVQYIEYARQQKAHKKLAQIFTDALRIHPTSSELWIYAAKYALDDHADMLQARGYMQRGLRFCKSSRKLWLQYAKLELIYIAKLVARQRILGLDKTLEPASTEPEASLDHNADVIKLPELTGEDMFPNENEIEEVGLETIQNLGSSPAINGDIPLAIFDSAMKNLHNDDRFGQEFYDMVLEFEDIPCLLRILEHVVDAMRTAKPSSPHTLICYIRLPTAGVAVTSAGYPRALGASLGRLREYRGDPRVAQEVINWLQPLANTEGVDPALHKAMAATIHSAEHTVAQA